MSKQRQDAVEYGPAAVRASEAPPRTKSSNYPARFASHVEGRVKRPLGDLFGLANFGVNLTCLPPGSATALRHRHSRQDEFVYVLEGEPTLVTDAGVTALVPGMCAGFRAGGTAHHLINQTEAEVVLLEIGDRSTGDEVTYPDDDLMAVLGSDARWRFTRKSGQPY